LADAEPTRKIIPRGSLPGYRLDTVLLPKFVTQMFAPGDSLWADSYSASAQERASRRV